MRMAAVLLDISDKSGCDQGLQIWSHFTLPKSRSFDANVLVRYDKASNRLQIRAFNNLIQPLLVMDIYDAIKLVDRILLHLNLDQLTIL